jgi:WD40 repeat protein
MIDDCVAAYVAHPALLWAFQTNRKQMEALLRCPPTNRLQPRAVIPFAGFVASHQRRLLIARGGLCVALAIRLLCLPQRRISRVPLLAAAILARRHTFAAAAAPSCAGELQGHGGTVFCVAFHPSASVLATSSSDRSAKLWRLQPCGQPLCLATLRGHSGWVMAAAFHARLPILATGSSNHTARLWRLNSSNSAASCFARLQGHSDHVRSVAFHTQDDVFATGSGDGSARLWRVQGERAPPTLLATLEGHGGCVNAVAFHPTARILATGSDDETAKLWRLHDDGGGASCVATLHGNKNCVLRASTLQGSNNLVRERIVHRVKIFNTLRRCCLWRSTRRVARWPLRATTARSSCGG